MKNDSSVFIEKLGDEALVLLRQAQDYISHTAPHHLNSIDARQSQMISEEILRLTTRLSEIIAFVIALKTFQLGHAKGKRPEWKPSNESLKPSEDSLPKELDDLLNQSLRLYERLTRLEKAIDN